MQFNESLAYLLSLGHETLAIKLGLRNTEILLAELGQPQQSFSSVQIAGTNGKGSTAVMLESICRAASIRAGLFTSPHLVSITERIKIAGADVSAEEFARCATHVRSAAESLVARGELQAPPTFFEQITAIALLAFKNAGVSLAILETGLGGRLDSTTVAGATVVGITPIALDHQEYLGTTLKEIAAEKAAIIRTGASAVVAAQEHEALAVILARAAETGAALSLIGDDATIESVTADGRFTVTFQTAKQRYPSVKLALRGRHQIGNAATAIGLAEALAREGWTISGEAIGRGIATAIHPGRLEHFHAYLLDGAHNPSAAQVLRDYLDEFVKVPLTLIFGAMREKNLQAMADILFPRATQIVLTRPANDRSASPEQLYEMAKETGAKRVSVTQSVAEALETATKLRSPAGLICVTGSLYLLGETKIILHDNDAAQTAAFQ